jgi:hypothetical protein
MNELFKIVDDMMDRAAANMPRAVQLSKTFAAWGLGRGNGCDREDLNVETLEQAVVLRTPPMVPAAHAKGGFPSFVILETDDTAREGEPRHVLHFYNVKVKRCYRRIGQFETAQQAAVPYAVHAGSLAMEQFEPRRAFSLRRGDDPITGRQPNDGRLIEIGRSA